MSEPDEKPVIPPEDGFTKALWGDPKGHWEGLDRAEDGVPSYTSMVIANLNDRTKLETAMRHQTEHKRFNA